MSLSSISFNKRICLFLILFLFSIAHKAFAEKNNIKPVINLPDAVAKLRAGNDIDAFLDFQILATEGNVDAQAYFGEMYRKGRGFGKNFISLGNKANTKYGKDIPIPINKKILIPVI